MTICSSLPLHREGGVVQEEPVGFATGDTVTYTDVIATINNRTVFYKITLIDKYLNRSAVKELVPVKIEHDGSLDKTFWSISTTGFIAKAVETPNGDDQDPCAKYTVSDPCTMVPSATFSHSPLVCT